MRARSLRLLFSMMRPYARRYALGIAALLLVDLAELVPPKVLGRLFDSLKAGTATEHRIFLFVCFILGFALLNVAGRYGWRIYVSATSFLIEYDLRNRMFRQWTKLSATYYNTHKSGDLMAHFTNDVSAVRRSLGFGMVQLFDAIFMSVFVIGTMLTINVKLAILALIPMPFLAYFATAFGRMIHRRFKIVQDAFAKMTDVVQENTNGIRVVKSFVQERAEIEKFRVQNDNVVEKNMHLVRVWGLFFPTNSLIGAVSLLIVVVYGGSLVMTNRISLGDFIAFYAYVMLLVQPITQIGQVINIMQRGSASLDRIQEILDTPPDITDAPDAVAPPLKGEIEVRGLTYRYRDELPPVLEDISFKLEPGKRLAIVGPTGSGKSTIVNLLLRIYEPPPGTMFIDGVDVRKLTLDALRTNVGYVPQESFLFAMNVADNIAFGRPDAERDEVVAASKAAQLHPNVLDFPNQYDTEVGERGVTLSGGQKQRVAIARALLKNPVVLIFDDSLSAVDTQTEERILEELRVAAQGRATITIAHRISSIKACDEILVLDGGRIIERGTHDELVALGGLYKEMHERQLLERQIEQTA